MQHFKSIAHQTLSHLLEMIDTHYSFIMEADIDGDALIIDIQGVGQYVIHLHNVLHQLWVSSPLSGAHHYLYDEKTKKWLSTRDHLSLSDLIEKEFFTLSDQKRSFSFL